jgi:hypothetical protein
MSDVFKNKPTTGFWVVSVLALLWNVMGVMAYLQQAYNTEEYRANFNEAQLAIIDATPAWATAAFAIAVFAGIIGCVLLLLRKKLAKTLFIISFLGIVVQNAYSFGFTDAMQYFKGFDWFLVISVPVIAILLIMYSRKAISRHWIT